MKSSAQSPGHITGFFAIYPNGSTGAGLNVAEGMKTTVRISGTKKDQLFMNGKKTRLIVSEKVLELFRAKTRKNQKVEIRHKTKFLIGFGLGISGSGALSLSHALSKLFKAKLNSKEILEIAKQAEIACGTGLGDVVAEQFAGLMMGNKPYPSKTITKIKCAEKYIAFGFFNPIITKNIIRSKEWKKKINKSGLECMKMLEKEKTMQKFMKCSRKFTIESGLGTEQILKVMQKIPNSGMSMLGETIFVPTNKPAQIEKELKKYCKRTAIGKIAQHGAGLL